jgi:hypothetical protein
MGLLVGRGGGVPVGVGLPEAEGGHQRRAHLHGHPDEAGALLQEHHLQGGRGSGRVGGRGSSRGTAPDQGGNVTSRLN